MEKVAPLPMTVEGRNGSRGRGDGEKSRVKVAAGRTEEFLAFPL